MMNEIELREEKVLESFKWVLNLVVEERMKFLTYLQNTNEECSFPLSQEIIKKNAIEDLKMEGKLPPFYEEL